MIPVRVPSNARPVLASDRIIELMVGHPLVATECPACGEPLIGGQPVVLVFVGMAPGNRKPVGAVTTGGAVTVHADCAGVAV